MIHIIFSRVFEISISFFGITTVIRFIEWQHEHTITTSFFNLPTYLAPYVILVGNKNVAKAPVSSVMSAWPTCTSGVG